MSVTSSGQTFVSQTAARKSILGRALTVLADTEPYVVDETSAVEVELIDPLQWITSCDDHALAEGTNLAMLGGELIQFGTALSLGNGRFRLSYLLRGRAGTEWATGSHAAGELFCLIDSNSLQPLAIPAWMRGSAVTVSDRNGATALVTFAAESVKPFAPANLASELSPSGDLLLSWTRRSRSGLAWLNEIDAPIGEGRELYSITISTADATLELTSQEPATVVSAPQLASIGTGAATVEVRQVGDWAASHPSRLIIDLS